MQNAFFSFLPLIIFGILVIFIVGIFLFIVLIGIRKTLASTWSGVIVDKVYATKEKDRKGTLIAGKRQFSHFYTLVVKTDDGTTRKVAVTKDMYDNCAIGDKLIKRKGALNPVKVV